ncbi:uncharacterized protein LOC108911782 [Anoplophora glabripennis]|uniref:uncharacterized protein LOC108911782 n=1 Tax=Anoplophora glabripennis TaxID=217634 RepID=UPI000874D2C3|nr:uncharacterized protein LOC108911782 [Anoplophora glabripennis]
MVKLASTRRLYTSRRRLICSSNVEDVIIILSRYTNTLSLNFGPRILSINLCVICAAFDSPKRKVLKWNSPRPGTEKAVFSLLSSLRGICQKALRVPEVLSVLVDVQGLST